MRPCFFRAFLVPGLLSLFPFPAVAQTGLVAAYSFDEGAGTTVADASGKANTGTLTSATWSAGKFGSAVSFNGSTSWITVNHSTSLSLTNAMTLEAWIMTPTPSGWRTVVMKESSGG